MNNMIKTVVEIDKQARERLAQVKERREQASVYISEQKKEIFDTAMANAKAELEMLRQEKNKELETQKSEEQKFLQSGIEKLEKQKDENFDRWVKELTDKVIG